MSTLLEAGAVQSEVVAPPLKLRNLRHTLAEVAPALIDGTIPLGSVRTAAGDRLQAQHVERASEALLHAGIVHGDRVVVRARHSVATVAWFAAIWHAGATLIPVSATIPDAALEAIVDDSGAVAVCDPETGTLTRHERRGESPFVFTRPRRVTGVDLALIIYTSGSTGRPKGILLTHTNVMSALAAITEYQRLSVSDTILCVPPLHFDYGLYQVLFAFYSGCAVVLAGEPAQPVAIIKQIKAHNPTVLPIVPAIGSGIAATMTAFSQAIGGVRLITNTGGHLPLPTIAALRNVFPGSEVMPMYGLTESKRALFMPAGMLDAHEGSVGLPMPGLEAKVFVETGNTTQAGTPVLREAQADEVGRLFVRGSSVMQGYNCDNGAGARLIPGQYRDDNWLDTGDLFSVDADGYFYFRGRDKELIKQGGFCLYPKDIEAIAESCDHALGAVLVGGVDKHGDEIACLFVLLPEGASQAQRDAFRDALKARIDGNYLPRRIEFINEWPLNANAKIDRRALARIVS